MSRLPDVVAVADRHMCSGCGTCAYLAPESYEMVDTLRGGRRPLKLLDTTSGRQREEEALYACPGRSLKHDGPLPTAHMSALGAAWGPVLELWEGYASDPEIRHAGSSGGVATALGLYCLEAGGMSGVLHTAGREDVPLLNRTVMSSSRQELLARSGSRYAPASPCEGLGDIEEASAPCVFIGKPCDVAGAAAASRVRPRLAQRLGLTVAVFCAGTPTTQGTMEAVRVLGISPDDVESVRYRGNGWPGRFAARAKGGREGSLSYEQSWGEILQRHRQWRCMVCADHTGEFADIAVGDPWYQPTGSDPGRSLVLVRTERGRRLLHAAVDAGAVNLERVAPDVLPRSQPNLVRTRGAVWGRLITMSALGMPRPRYRRLPMFRSWLALDRREKVRSTAGTAKRVFARRMHRASPAEPWSGGASAGAELRMSERT
jgi:coenzyme F420 hydrogenase subunit beta